MNTEVLWRRCFLSLLLAALTAQLVGAAPATKSPNGDVDVADLDEVPAVPVAAKVKPQTVVVAPSTGTQAVVSVPGVLTSPTGEYSQYSLVLEKGLAGRSLTVRIHFREGVFTRGWTVPDLGEAPTAGGAAPGEGSGDESYVVDVSGMKRTGNTITGDVPLRYTPFPSQQPVASYTVDLKVEGVKLNGSYKGLVSGSNGAKDQQVAGTVSGDIKTETELRTLYGIATGKDFPCHRGSLGSGTAPSSGKESVTHPCQARLLWRSEEPTPGAYYYDRNPWTTFGGFSGPMVYGGRVYVYYVEPTGEITVDPKTIMYPPKGPTDYNRTIMLLEGQDVLLCMDAATGATVWKQTFRDTYNPSEGRKGGPYNTPCAGNGAVFMQSGVTGKVRAFDTATGKKIWEFTDLPVVAVSMKNRELALQKGMFPFSYRGGENAGGVYNFITSAPQLADGVLAVATDEKQKCALVGLDAKTGVKVWGPVGENTAPGPVRWTHKGKEYFITSGGACVEPKTGKILWNVRTAIWAVCEDYMISSAGGRGGVTCFKIDPTQAVQVWSLPADQANCGWMSGPTIYDGHVYGIWEPKGIVKEWSLFCAELATGKITSQKSQGRFALAYFPVAADGRLWGQEGQEFDLNPTDFKCLGGGIMPGATGTSPALADGRLFFRARWSVFCYDVRRPSDEELTRIRVRREKEVELVMADFRAGKMNTASVAKELSRLGEAGVPFVAEEMRKAIEKQNATVFGAFAEVAGSFGQSAGKSLGPLLNQALASGRGDLALGAVKGVGILSGEEAERAKTSLLGFIRGDNHALWEQASIALRSLDASSEEAIVREMSRFGKTEKVEKANAAMGVLASLGWGTTNRSVRTQAIAAITAQLDSVNVESKRKAIVSLAGFGADAKGAVEKLRGLAVLPDTEKDAKQTLEKIAPGKESGAAETLEVPDL